MFSINSLSNGTHTIFFKVKDDSDVWSEEVSIQITIHSIPTARITSVSNTTASENDPITFNGNGTDEDGVDQFVWTSDLDGGLFKGTVSFFTISNLSVGTHTISLRVVDIHGIPSDLVSVSVVVSESPVDSTPPVITITTPKDKATVSGNVTFSGTASDETKLSKIEFRFLGADEWSQTKTEESWSFSLNTSELEDGEYTMEFRSFDLVQYSDVATVMFTVDNAGGGGGNGEEGSEENILLKEIGPLPLIGYVGLLIVVLILVMAVGKRGGKKKPESFGQNAMSDLMQGTVPPTAATLPVAPPFQPPAQPPTAPATPQRQFQPQYQQPPSSQTPPPQAMGWSCPQCSATVDGQYAFCMNCGYRKGS